MRHKLPSITHSFTSQHIKRKNVCRLVHGEPGCLLAVSFTRGNKEKVHRFVRLKYELWQQVLCTAAAAAVALHARPSKVRKDDAGFQTGPVAVATIKKHTGGRSKSSYKTGTPAETAIFASCFGRRGHLVPGATSCGHCSVLSRFVGSRTTLTEVERKPRQTTTSKPAVPCEGK